MTNKSAPHSLFELSMLLSSLQKYGVDLKSFEKISTEFGQNDMIAEDLTHDATRFAPHSLQSLYLQVLREEVRAASQYSAQQAKRIKSPTPPLRSLDEARTHKHLLAGLAEKYHIKYVEQIRKEIVADEKTYIELFKEIQALQGQSQEDNDIPKPITNAAQVTAGTRLDENFKDTVLTSKDERKSFGGQPGNAPQSFENSQQNSDRGSITVGHSLLTPNNKQSTAGLATSLSSNPTTPSLSQQLAAPSKKGLPIPSIVSSNISTFSSALDNLHQVGDTAKLRSPNHSPNLPSYATPGHLSGPTKSMAVPTERTSYFGTAQSTPTAKPPARGPLPASFTPLPSKMFGHTTPSSSIIRKRRHQGLAPIDTSCSSTKWKESARSIVKDGRSPTRPGNSPYLSDSPSPELESRDAKRLSSIDAIRAIDTPTRGRGRGRWPSRRRGRGGRIPISSPEARIRSQSAVSGIEDSTAEGSGSKFKIEPPMTPGVAGEVTSFVSTPVESKPGIRRRDVLRDGETPKPNLKRKRADTSDSIPEINTVNKFSRPGQVLASKNFPRIVSALLNDINSHKLASVFAKPITEKSAPGYTSLIYRPQDLKSIRSSISAGSRFVATIPATDVSQDDLTGGDTPAATPSAATTKATNIWVDRTAEVIPAKGIVNSAQLEKELCRMLANAVMYNPDPKRGFGPKFRMTHPQRSNNDSDIEMEDEHDLDDGRLVNDAREMFESVEQAVAAWRAAERINPDDKSFKTGGIEKIDDQMEDVAENTGTEDADGEKSSLRRSARG